MLAAAHGIDEILPIISWILSGRARLPVLAENRVPLAIIFGIDREIPFGAVERSATAIPVPGANIGFMIRNPMPHLEHHVALCAAIVEFVSRGQCVGRLLIVVEHVVAAHSAHLGRIFHAETPTADIHLMDSLIAEIAIAVVPEPMPRVMEAVVRECV